VAKFIEATGLSQDNLFDQIGIGVPTFGFAAKPYLWHCNCLEMDAVTIHLQLFHLLEALFDGGHEKQNQGQDR
jgi:hypothetical protein